jgi:hypothetical protein
LFIEVPNIAVSFGIVKWLKRAPSKSFTPSPLHRGFYSIHPSAAARFFSVGFSSISVHAQQLVMHARDNYNVPVRHRPSEAVVQSCLFTPLVRLVGMTDAGCALRCDFPIVSDEPRDHKPEDLQ